LPCSQSYKAFILQFHIFDAKLACLLQVKKVLITKFPSLTGKKGKNLRYQSKKFFEKLLVVLST